MTQLLSIAQANPAVLHEKGLQVLLVDLDPQGHLTRALGLPDASEPAILPAAMLGQWSGELGEPRLPHLGGVGLKRACLVDLAWMLGVVRRVTVTGWAQVGQVPSAERTLGALLVVADFCRRLRIRETVDELCPMREVSTSVVSHGQMVEVLVANRLTSPTPLADVEAWAQEWAVGEVFGVSPEALNDDRAGRGLDAIAEVLDKVTGSVGLTAIEVFGLDVTRMHWDMTSISLHGAYPEPEQEFAVPKFGHPKFGHPKDRRPDLKQIQTGLAVTGDGGVPVFARAYDGGAGEVGQVVGVMQALQELAGPARMLIVGDSRLVSYT